MDEPHICEGFVLSCMDFRYHKQVSEILKKEGLVSFDLKCDAGGVKYLVSTEKPAVREWILSNMEISKNLHHIKKIILINHFDCGAYGGNAAFDSEESQLDFHKQQLTDAKVIVASKFPDLEVTSYFAIIRGEAVELKSM